MSENAKKKAAYQKGVAAELQAELYFKTKGYGCLARRYKCRYGEIDLILQKGRNLVFAEVKAHKTKEAALDAVTPKSRERIARAAEYFLSQNQEYVDYDMRFDVLVIVSPFEILHLDNAWQLGS